MAKEEKKEEVVKQPTPQKEEKKEEKIGGSDAFIEALKDHLRAYAKQDPLFLAKLKNPKKNIKDCMTYILNQAMANAKNGVMGYHDNDVYKLARHYYDEEDIKVGEPITNAAIAINKQVELSEEEITEAKQTARDRVISEEMTRMRKKPEKKKPVTVQDVKKEQDQEEGKIGTQSSLF